MITFKLSTDFSDFCNLVLVIFNVLSFFKDLFSLSNLSLEFCRVVFSDSSCFSLLLRLTTVKSSICSSIRLLFVVAATSK